MNKTITYDRPFRLLATEYIMPSKTIEIIGSGQDVAYVYNHDGLYFSLFPTIIDLAHYLTGNNFNRVSFESEEAYDNLFIAGEPITLELYRNSSVNKHQEE